jgi:hemerythrin-like domain-containing protein
MRATEILTNEHRIIELVLNCLEEMTDRALEEGELNVGAARMAVDFLRHYGDYCHHGKEERHLFRALESHGFAHEHGPVGRMLYEHDLLRQLLKRLETAIAEAESGGLSALQRYADAAHTYVAFRRDHIAKEDQHLFPLANRILTEADNAALVRSFAHVEAHEMGTGAHEKYLRLADELARHFHVPRTKVDLLGGSTGASRGRPVMAS